jgi:SSS family solute:Na+ symporter
MNNLLPSGVRGLLLASLIAALVSSLIAVLNSVSTLIVRDFVLEFNPAVSEKKQVLLGRVCIVLVTLLGVSAAYLVYKNEEGLYKYLQTITSYLVIPVFPAIFFGICSRKVTLKGAAASVIAGIVIATVFVIDQMMSAETAAGVFPFLHAKYTAHFGFRGLWAELLITAVLFGVSACTPKTAADKLEKTTVSYSGKIAPFAGWKDWRLYLCILSAITLFIWISLY